MRRLLIIFALCLALGCAHAAPMVTKSGANVVLGSVWYSTNTLTHGESRT